MTLPHRLCLLCIIASPQLNAGQPSDTELQRILQTKDHVHLEAVLHQHEAHSRLQRICRVETEHKKVPLHCFHLSRTFPSSKPPKDFEITATELADLCSAAAPKERRNWRNWSEDLPSSCKHNLREAEWDEAYRAQGLLPIDDIPIKP